MVVRKLVYVVSDFVVELINSVVAIRLRVLPAINLIAGAYLKKNAFLRKHY